MTKYKMIEEIEDLKKYVPCYISKSELRKMSKWEVQQFLNSIFYKFAKKIEALNLYFFIYT